MCFMPACGKRARGRGRTATDTAARAAASSSPLMAAARGIKLQVACPKIWCRLTSPSPPSDPSRLYRAWRRPQGVGIYRSDDAGENWQRITTDARPAIRIGGGDLPVPSVDPKDPDVVYSASTVTWRSQDGGKTWTGVSRRPRRRRLSEHLDQSRQSETILLVSDQGAIVTVNGGQTWSSWYNQPTAQLYHVIADNEFPYRVCAGQQESGSVCISSRGNDGEITFREWHPVGVIEYGYVAPDPLHPDIVYGAGRGEVSKFHWRHRAGAERYAHACCAAAIIAPIAPSPSCFRPSIRTFSISPPTCFSRRPMAGVSWQTISPDLTRPHPGIPASLGEPGGQRPNADKAARRGLCLGAVVPEYQYPVGRHRRRLDLDHPRRRQEMEQHHPPGAHARGAR